jgi:hypothetical protein
MNEKAGIQMVQLMPSDWTFEDYQAWLESGRQHEQEREAITQMEPLQFEQTYQLALFGGEPELVRETIIE